MDAGGLAPELLLSVRVGNLRRQASPAGDWGLQGAFLKGESKSKAESKVEAVFEATLAALQQRALRRPETCNSEGLSLCIRKFFTGEVPRRALRREDPEAGAAAAGA